MVVGMAGGMSYARGLVEPMGGSIHPTFEVNAALGEVTMTEKENLEEKKCYGGLGGLSG
jgi:hypothetical protein